MLAILRKARLKDKEMRILMLYVFSIFPSCMSLTLLLFVDSLIITIYDNFFTHYIDRKNVEHTLIHNSWDEK